MATTLTSTKAGLTRLTVVAPKRRLDVVLPERLALGSLLPGLLQRAGEDLADEGESHGGWALRTALGERLDPESGLAEQNVLDGATLYLVPRETGWPEIDYDDMVDAIAAAARRKGYAWTAATTRTSGLVLAVAVLAAGPVVAVASGARWMPVGTALIASAVALLLAAVLAARSFGDSLAGAVIGAVAAVYAAIGGMVVLSPPGSPAWDVDSVDLAQGSAALLLVCAGAYIGVAQGLRLFAGGISTALVGLLGVALATLDLDVTSVAAVLAAVVSIGVAALPLLAMKLGRLPMPTLPQSPEDLMRDDPQPSSRLIRASVARSDEILTGLIASAALCGAICEAFLAAGGGVAAPVLSGIVAAVLALRGRLFPMVRHRAPLLLAGLAGLTSLTVPMVTMMTEPVGLTLGFVILLVVALGGAAAGSAYMERPVSPYVARAAELIEVILIVSVLPLAGAVVGAYAYARALAG